MKNLITTVILLAIVIWLLTLTSCSKRADQLPTSYRWLEIKQIWTDSAFQMWEADTMYNQILTNPVYIDEVRRAKDSTWKKVCSPEGITLHWELWIEQLKNNQ